MTVTDERLILVIVQIRISRNNSYSFVSAIEIAARFTDDSKFHTPVVASLSNGISLVIIIHKYEQELSSFLRYPSSQTTVLESRR